MKNKILIMVSLSGDPWLDGKTHSLEVGNRPAAYILEVEEEKMNDIV
jgi:hypothetical protein